MKILFAMMILAGSTTDEVIRRGDSVTTGVAPVSIEKVLEMPDAYAKKAVVVDGVIAQACSRKGCWMELVPEAGKPGMRVTFKDYGFFVPLDSKGMAARAEGVTKVRTLSKKEADHLSEEGAKLTRNADGTAREVSFVASGVELRRK
jgi:2-keto-4-pentenoate hydratase